MNSYLLAFLSGLFAGIVAICVTKVIERFGGVIGGTPGYELIL